MSSVEPAAPSHKPLSRRDFLRITAAAGGAVAAGYLFGRRVNRNPAVYQESRLLMGALVNLTLVAPREAEARAAAAAVFAEMERLIALLDHRRPASPLAVLNRQGRLDDAPPELLEVIESALAYGRLTDGAFDISVKPLLDHIKAGGDGASFNRALIDYRQIMLAGRTISLARPGMALTLDGIGKGYVVDGAAACLQANGFGNILVEAGGDLVGYGRRADGAAWQIGVAHPRAAAPTAMTHLSIYNRAAATSGDYRHAFTHDFRRHHILDPRLGQSPPELASVTITAPSALDADALSTALMVLGVDDGLALARRLPHVEAIMATKNLDIFRTT